MLDISPFTDEQWWAMCDANMSLPEPLAKADLTKPFVYERRFGVFYVPFGYHQLAMGTLLAFQHGLTKPGQVAELLNLNLFGTGGHWLEHTEGACFFSSVGRTFQVWNPRSLNAIERRILGVKNITYICS